MSHPVTTARWWAAAGIRGVKTVAQTAVALIGTSALIVDVPWEAVASASVLAGIVSLLTSLGGLPELDTPIAGVPELDTPIAGLPELDTPEAVDDAEL